jgi:hypothetical protein
MIYFKCNDFIIVDESGCETIVVVVVDDAKRRGARKKQNLLVGFTYVEGTLGRNTKNEGDTPFWENEVHTP